MNTLKMTLAAAAVLGLGLVAVPKASACDSCLSQPAIVGGSVLTQPAVIDSSMTAPVVLTQPAVINTAPAVAPVYNDMWAQPVRSNLINLDTPFFGIHLF